jgi:hypothetical protein
VSVGLQCGVHRDRSGNVRGVQDFGVGVGDFGPLYFVWRWGIFFLLCCRSDSARASWW